MKGNKAEILISDRQDIKINKKVIKELCIYVLGKERADDASEVSISLVSPKEMRQLNKRFRGIDKATEVLSFSLKEPSDSLLGDVVLCPEEAGKRAPGQGQESNYRLVLLIIHGILHLLGYNHENDKEAEVMDKNEEQFIKEVGSLKIL